MRDWNEYNLVEKPALETFEKLGWKVYDREEFNEEEVPDNRVNLKKLVLKDRLRDAIKRLNGWIDENNLNKAIRQITKIEATGPMDGNKKIHQKLTSHISLEQDRGKGKKHQTVKFIDWENPENNDFLVLSQHKVAGPKENIKPDLVAFVNGIPLGVIECKNPTKAEPEEKGLDQMTRYQNVRGGEDEGAEKLFWYNQFSAVCWKEGAVSGTYGTPKSEYKAWKDPYPETDEDIKNSLRKEEISPQDRLLYSMFKKERILDMIQNFTVFEESGQRTKKMVARYQQYRAVQKALERIEKRDREPTDGGVVWHTQGSGKSLTMLFLGLKLRRRKDNPTLLLVTDRTALDIQIHSTFEQCGFPNPKRAKSIKDLKRKLRNNAGETITTLIQKFQTEEDEETFDVLSRDEDIFILVDEAHRTQYKELANNMRTSLPNAFYIGFTGTPIEKEKRNTRKTFGNYIDTYTIDQSIEDGTTIPILYQGRLADIHLDGADLDELFERIFSDKSEKEKAEIKKRYAQERHLAEAPKRIEKICLDLVKHYEKKIGEPFTGMIVTASRRAAVNYKKQLDKLNAPESAVIISGDHNDPEEFKKHTPSEKKSDDLKGRFKDPEDDLKFLIVCDMLLTGFDAPVAQIMYLDKPLKEHSLLQAVARVNRPYEDKNSGLIIDYYGISDDLYQALDKFSKKDVEKALTPLKDEKPKLESAHGKAISFFNEVDKNDLEECVEVLEDEDVRIGFNNAYKKFSKMMDIVMPDPMANPYKEDLKWLGKVYQAAKNRYRDDSMNLTGCGKKVRDLIQDHISSSGIEILNQEPVSILNKKEFEKRIDSLETKKAKASEMENALKKEISARYERDPVFYDSLQKKVEELIERYKQKRLEEKKLIDEFENLIMAVRSRKEEAKRMGLADSTELAIYNTLEITLLPQEEFEESLIDSRSSKKSLRNLTKDITSIFESERVVDWKQKIKTMKNMKRQIKLRILEDYNNLDKDQLNSLTNRLLELGRKHFK